ncbi:MAG: hypothetical protein ACP5FH_06115 [Terracidiphilus sp.]
MHRHSVVNVQSGLLISFCAAILLWTAVLPLARAFQLEQINYNEGWNVYNAMKVAEHQLLYATVYDWTSVNYPALSFHLIAALGNSPSSYLFAGRILSLLGLCLGGIFAGLIVWQVTREKMVAWLSGMFLVAIFCANATDYIGMDDPQMLALGLFIAGLYVYVRGGGRGWTLDLTALLFVLGGNIKHNPIEFPLAVLLDLLLSSPRKALRYAAVGGLLAAFSVVLTSHIDGSAYVSCLLAPRQCSWKSIPAKLYIVLVPILLPVAAAWRTSFFCWKNPAQRVLSLLLFCAMAVDAFFSGGVGVVINALFGSMVAIVLLCGVFWAEFSRMPLGRFRALPQAVVCAFFFLWLAAPMFLSRDTADFDENQHSYGSATQKPDLAQRFAAHIALSISDGNWRTMRALRLSQNGERYFATDVAYLRRQPGLALCEDLLQCAVAGKPYLYDPFNATRFINLGKLDANVIVDRLRDGDYGAVQIDRSSEQGLSQGHADSRFALPILLSIQKYYRPGLMDEGEVIYIPKKQGQ